MMDFRAARAIADAVLYEGYLLYPYTASAMKNKLRWQFGVVVPTEHEAAGTGEHGRQQTELLVEHGDGARIDVLLRFLQVQSRKVERWNGASFVAVPELTVGGMRYLPFDESVACEVRVSLAIVDRVAGVPIEIDGARLVDELYAHDGSRAGRVVRERWPLRGALLVEYDRVAVAAASTVGRLRVRLENTSDVVPAGERGVVLRTAFVSAHTLIGIDGGAFWSPIDPPDPDVHRTVSPANAFTWPVLVGSACADSQRSPIVLSSPIILADFPQIAPQTRADTFDGTEIDELLNLAVLSLSAAEREEARATDPRARALVERAEAFDAHDIARTHAQLTALDASPPVSIDVRGVAVTTGSSVRLVPTRRADAQDMFLAGKIATVQAIHQDFDERVYVAVTIDDDPASEYHQWYGRSFFFAPEEVEPVVARS